MQPDAVQALIARFVAACRGDDRVLAAVLCGSHARGTADTYSDLDLGLVVTPEAQDDFVAGWADFVRHLGEPLFLESFDLPHVVFVIFADGSEVELSLLRAIQPGAAYRVLLDKGGLPAGALPAAPRPDRTEALRRLVTWFWHDLSHFLVAMGRRQLWWAHGQLEELRRVCIDLARLQHDFTAEPEGYWKVDAALPAEPLAALEETLCPLEFGALLRSGRSIVSFYQRLAPLLARQHGIAYPAALEQVMLERLRALEEAPPN